MAFHIDDSDAVEVMPHPSAVSTAKRQYFQNGNPATGKAATVVDADWLNMIQNEILNVVESAGFSPDKQDHRQLLQAIQLYAGKATGTYDAVAHQLMLRNEDARSQVADPVHDLDAVNWRTVMNLLKSSGAGYNRLETITVSQTWTAPKDGWYKVTCIGAGGSGGRGGAYSRGGVGGKQGGSTRFGDLLTAEGGSGGGGGGSISGGGGGAAGKIRWDYIALEAGQSIPVVVGAGGVTPEETRRRPPARPAKDRRPVARSDSGGRRRCGGRIQRLHQ